MLNRIFITLFLLVISSPALAEKLDFRLGQDMARLSYSSLVSGTTFGRTEVSGGFMYNDAGNTLLDLGLQVIDMAGTKTPGLEIGVGPRLYIASLDTPSASGTAVALGGNLRYKSPDVERVAFYGSLYYAPGITSFMDADSLLEYGFGAAYEVLPTADAYIGYQSINMDINTGGGGNHDLDDGFIIGMRMAF